VRRRFLEPLNVSVPLKKLSDFLSLAIVGSSLAELSAARSFEEVAENEADTKDIKALVPPCDGCK